MKKDFTCYFDRKLVALQRYRPLMYTPGDTAHEEGLLAYPRASEDYYLMSGCLDACELVPAGGAAWDDVLVTLRGADEAYGKAEDFIDFVSSMDLGG